MSTYTQTYLAEYTGLSDLVRANIKDSDELKIDFATFVHRLVAYNQRPIDERLLSAQHAELVFSETQLFDHFAKMHLDKMALTENKAFSVIREAIEGYDCFSFETNKKGVLTLFCSNDHADYNEEGFLIKLRAEYNVSMADLLKATVTVAEYISSNIKSGTREYSRMSNYLTNIIALTNKLSSVLSNYYHIKKEQHEYN